MNTLFEVENERISQPSRTLGEDIESLVAGDFHRKRDVRRGSRSSYRAVHQVAIPSTYQALTAFMGDEKPGYEERLQREFGTRGHIVSLALREGIANTIRHAHENNENGITFVSRVHDEACMYFIVHGGGRGFDPSEVSIRCPDTMSTSGRGGFLMGKADLLAYSNDGTTLYLGFMKPRTSRLPSARGDGTSLPSR